MGITSLIIFFILLKRHKNIRVLLFDWLGGDEYFDI